MKTFGMSLLFALCATVSANAAPIPENGVTAHRGDSIRYPENSLQAFASACDLGVDWIETDVHLTADKQLVISHNGTTGAYCNTDKKISACTYEELAQLDMAENYRDRNLLTLLECPKLKICRLDEALDLILQKKTARLSIQPKCACVDQVIEMVRKKGAVKWVGFNDGNQEWMSRVKELEPAIPVFWDRFNSDVEKDIAFAKEKKFETLVYFWRNMKPEMVKRLHEEGFKAGVWTVDLPAAQEHFLDMGIDRIYTDAPRQLLEIKAQRDASPVEKAEKAVLLKLEKIIIPEINFRPPATLMDAVQFLRKASRDYDDPTLAPEKRGINFLLKLPQDGDRTAKETEKSSALPVIPAIHARFITLKDTLQLICDVTGMMYDVKGSVVVIAPKIFE
ncbi:MAG: hypothetical protein IJR99_07155 [Kiritimatiellae bacterium]|nr:hypothetical protein [Kiritimatiellia bacterium]